MTNMMNIYSKREDAIRDNILAYDDSCKLMRPFTGVTAAMAGTYAGSKIAGHRNEQEIHDGLFGITCVLSWFGMRMFMLEKKKRSFLRERMKEQLSDHPAIFQRVAQEQQELRLGTSMLWRKIGLSTEVLNKVKPDPQEQNWEK